MALLDDIIRDATTDEVPLTTVLRKTLILSTDLKNDTLKEWVRRELNGYPNADDLPDYRMLHTQAQGTLIGYAYILNDQIISPHLLEEKHRKWATTARLSEPASAYEAILVKAEPDGHFQIPWPPQYVVYYQQKIAQGYVLNKAWLVVPMGGLSAIVDIVRTRILEFALEIRQEAGGSEDLAAAVPAATIQEKVVSQIFNGNVTMANSITGGVSQIGKIVIKGDFNTLASALAKSGIPDNEIVELETAIAADTAEGAKSGFGTRVAEWMGERAQNLGDNVVAQGVGAAVMAYFGLG